MSDNFPKSKTFITFAAMKRFMKEVSNLLVSSEAVEELIDALEAIAKKRTLDAARITKTFNRKTITKEVMKTIRENSK
ncbi:MAG: NFYB/HAP3 family transcription factor subunit [Candidatus Heimdallarchaeota archaeon]